MRTNILMLFAVLSFILLSCESKDKWINQHDSQADMGDSAKICKQVDVECGKKWINYSGVDLEINCGECSNGYECRYNTCWDIDECENPDLNNCPEHSTCANEEGTYSCICDDNYTWIDSECVEKPQEEPDTDDSGDSTPADSDTSDSTDDSDSAPDNSDSTPDDDADTADSTDDSSDSQPDDSDTTDDADTYAPDEDDTEPDEEPTTRTATCSGLPANAEWNTTSNITQTWDGEKWIPESTAGVYNEAASTTECRFKCKTNYTWTNSVCKADSKVSNCTGLPENAMWNTVSTISQTWNGEDWQPSTAGIYNTTASTTECRFKCEENYYWWGENAGCTTQKPGLGNICTGQTSCYNASSSMTCPTSSSADFFGQDAQYTGKCTAQSFTIKTVSDQKVVLDNNTGLMWQQTIPTSTYTWDKAVSYCNNLTYASYTDWRLPTPKELLTIVDNSKYDPAIDTTYFPNTPSSGFWSSFTDVLNTNFALRVHFNYGSVSLYDNTNNYKVRCVRGAALPTGSFTSSTIQGDVIVTDTETALMWQKTYVSGKTWQQALSYCESLTYAGYSDWRLPDKNELASLVNYEKYNPASDFPDMPSQYFWSSSTYASNTSSAWIVSFGYGYVNGGNKTGSFYVRCVRK